MSSLMDGVNEKNDDIEQVKEDLDAEARAIARAQAQTKSVKRSRRASHVAQSAEISDLRARFQRVGHNRQ